MKDIFIIIDKADDFEISTDPKYVIRSIENGDTVLHLKGLPVVKSIISTHTIEYSDGSASNFQSTATSQ